MTPKNSPSGRPSAITSVTTTSMPSGSARVSITARVCGKTSRSTTSRGLLDLPARRSRVMASAAAVASSSMELLAISMPVRSETMVWKLSSASRRPWLISGWYGVYAVYQAGFSMMLRSSTGGVSVS
ncbi:hypothetical protein TSST111916_11100 [Tsukamurella strandjordii]